MQSRAKEGSKEGSGAAEREREVWDKPGTQTDTKSNCTGRFQEADSVEIEEEEEEEKEKDFFSTSSVQHTAESAHPIAAAVA